MMNPLDTRAGASRAGGIAGNPLNPCAPCAIAAILRDAPRSVLWDEGSDAVMA